MNLVERPEKNCSVSKNACLISELANSDRG